MSVEITTAMVEQYSANVIHLSQQKGSRLADCVRREMVRGKNHYFDRIGATAAQQRTTRHADTPQIDTPHSRRRVSLVDYDWADLIDNLDKVRVIMNPESEYAIAGGRAHGRAIDDEIIAAMTGNAYSGVAGATTVALPSGQKVAVASAGLTIAKLVSARKILLANEVDKDQPWFIATSAEQLEDLLNNTTVTSSDYNTVKALVDGEIDTFLGFTFKHSERLGTDANGDRQVVAWAESAMGLAIGQVPVTDIGPRRDKNMAMQVFISMAIGATRIEDEAVVEIACSE